MINNEIIDNEVRQTLDYFTPDKIEEVYAVAFNFYQNGKYQEALSIFRLLSLSNPHEQKYWAGLGACHKMLKNYADAVQSYTLAAMIDETDPMIFFHSADCLFSLGMIENALQMLDSVEQVIGQDKEKHTALLAQTALLRDAWSGQNKKNTL